MNHGWSEADLEDLRCLFYGEGKHANVPPYMIASFITHPDSPDPNQQSLYAGCCELERRELIRSRVLPNGTSVAFYGPRDPEWETTAADVRVTPLIGAQ